MEQEHNMSFSERFIFDIYSSVDRHEIVIKDVSDGEWAHWTTFAVVPYDSGEGDPATALMHMLNGVGYNPLTGETDDHRV